MTDPCGLSGVNQYIGARYVPLLDGAWDITKEYEPLTVVLWEGSSYTSNCYVPVGIDIKNVQYWSLTGNYNAQVEKYRQEVEEYQKNVTKLETNVTGLESELTNALQKLYTSDNSNLVTVSNTGGGMYTTINDAINNNTGKTNLIIVVFSGVYNEEVNINRNGIVMVGLGNVIVRYPSVYPNSPLFVRANFTCYNIYFDSRGGTNSYGFHYEVNASKNTFSVTFYNCRFHSDSNASVGIGTGGGTIITFNNCDFMSFVSAGLYAHNGNGNLSGESQVIRIHRCNFYGSLAMRLDDATKGEFTSILTLTCSYCTSDSKKIEFRPLDGSPNLPYVESSNYNLTNCVFNDMPALNNEGVINFTIRTIKITGKQYGFFFPYNTSRYNFSNGKVNPLTGDPSYEVNILPASTRCLVVDGDTSSIANNQYVSVSFTAKLK